MMTELEYCRNHGVTQILNEPARFPIYDHRFSGAVQMLKHWKSFFQEMHIWGFILVQKIKENDLNIFYLKIF